MQWYVQTDDDGRIVAVMPGEFEDVNADTGEVMAIASNTEGWIPFDVPEGIRDGGFEDYIIADGKLVQSEAPWKAEARKAEAAAKARAETLENLAQYQADTDAALCEIYEANDKAQADTDAALCEIYEMLIGGK